MYNQENNDINLQRDYSGGEMLEDVVSQMRPDRGPIETDFMREAVRLWLQKRYKMDRGTPRYLNLGPPRAEAEPNALLDWIKEASSTDLKAPREKNVSVSDLQRFDPTLQFRPQHWKYTSSEKLFPDTLMPSAEEGFTSTFLVPRMFPGPPFYRAEEPSGLEKLWYLLQGLSWKQPSGLMGGTWWPSSGKSSGD